MMLETYQVILLAMGIYALGGMFMVFIVVFSGDDASDGELMAKVFTLWPLLIVIVALWGAAVASARLAAKIKDKLDA